ncbi:MAG: tol-pal system protein YbgF [Nitrospiraceae bacterium]|nr:tol-pal system protein YbgF [Nitrospiraceae bacterium]
MTGSAILQRISGVISLLFSAGVILIASGCATTADLENMRQSISTTHRLESIEQKKEVDALKAKVSEMSGEMSSVKERSAKESTVEALREGQTNLISRVNELSKDVQMLKGRFEESKFTTDKSVKDMSSEKEVLASRMAALEKEIKELKAKNAQPAEAKKDAAQPVTEKIDPQQLYDDAQIAMQEKKYSDARKHFETIVKDFPENQLAPNAQFWTGEAFYAEKKYEEAVLAYESFLKKYPKHEKIRGAMLKQGYAFVELGDKKTAKVILEKLIEKYPTSKEAKLAEKKLAEILPQKKAAKTSKKKTK